MMKNWLIPKKPKRLLILIVLLALVVAGEGWYRRWQPVLEVRTDHYLIASSATADQTQQIAEAAEAVYAAHRDLFAGFPGVDRNPARLQLKLFKDRQEFRRCNRGVGWAEAFYRKPACYAYYAAEEINPRHWMIHEAAHQLNAEVAHLRLAQWCNEGLAEYFSTSVFAKGTLKLGWVDPNTYPIWWLDDLRLTGDLAKDMANRQIIPLRAIVSGKGGPKLNDSFNLYYIHWWSLTHFLFHYGQGQYRAPYFRVVQEGGTQASFEKHIGPIDCIQSEWYRYLPEQRRSLSHGAPGR